MTFGRDVQVRTLSGERMDSATVTPGKSGPRITLAFDIEFFNGAPHAGAIIVPLPVRWANGDFALDLPALIRPAPSPAQANARVAAMTHELREWLAARQNPAVLYPPEAPSGTPITAKALVEAMLSGHADLARTMLDRSWPRRNGGSPGGKERFWADLCHAVRAQPLWQRFGLGRLPHADLIVAGAEHRAG
ncbi:hypothetical protein [Sphingomonas aurea]|uniref:hypothetical protein n=1 Tax=Sphingomonas aurea TaxID=3063994 RepID=UPI0027313643|nr:hypothetical protein [Sphingomonas sp. KR1UV-12]